MRRIVCRFEDESDFLKQFRWTRATCATADFSFVGEFQCEPGETIHLTALVSRSREQCNIEMRIVDVVPLAMDRNGEAMRVYRQRARVAPADAIWLRAFETKMATLHRIEQAA